MSNGDAAESFDTHFPARSMFSLIGDRWTTVVLYCLSLREVRRFNELQRQIPDISKKMLVQTLRSLERDGLVERTVYPQVPPKTEYRLTEDGHRLREPIAELCRWAVETRPLSPPSSLVATRRDRLGTHEHSRSGQLDHHGRHRRAFLGVLAVVVAGLVIGRRSPSDSTFPLRALDCDAGPMSIAGSVALASAGARSSSRFVISVIAEERQEFASVPLYACAALASIGQKAQGQHLAILAQLS